MSMQNPSFPSQLPPVAEPDALVIWLQTLLTALKAIDARLKKLEQKENRSCPR